jgi:ribonuclease HII
LTDSKKLSAKKRVELDKAIRQTATVGLGWVMPDELDRIGLAQALRTATIRAVEQIDVPYHEIMIDGTINFLDGTTKGSYVTTLPKGDMLVPAISAASIVAKVARDTYMAEQDATYQGYGFARHVGYGTAAHRAAIEELGLTPLHRRSFAPIAKLVDPTGTALMGRLGEEAASAFLKARGHDIIARNWRRPRCEIDIVSQFKGVTYITEVKTRQGSVQGGGIAALTPSRVRQLRFAAQTYAAAHPQVGILRLQLVAVDAAGEVTDILEIE